MYQVRIYLYQVQFFSRQNIWGAVLFSLKDQEIKTR